MPAIDNDLPCSNFDRINFITLLADSFSRHDNYFVFKIENTLIGPIARPSIFDRMRLFAEFLNVIIFIIFLLK